MTGIQVSLFQLDNYGPWTTTPRPKPEPTLQALQARIYADLAEGIGEAGGYLFYGRFDNLFAITNGVDKPQHRELQRKIAETYPVTVSAGIGTGETPAAAATAASETLQAAGSAQEPTRESILVGTPATKCDRLQVAHFDVIDVTRKFTDSEAAYPTFLQINEAVAVLSEYLYQEVGAITHFVGGDNAIAVSQPLPRRTYEEALTVVTEETNIELQVGIGSGATAVEAGQSAKRSLETCREAGERIVGARAPPAGD